MYSRFGKHAERAKWGQMHEMRWDEVIVEWYERSLTNTIGLQYLNQSTAVLSTDSCSGLRSEKKSIRTLCMKPRCRRANGPVHRAGACIVLNTRYVAPTPPPPTTTTTKLIHHQGRRSNRIIGGHKRRLGVWGTEVTQRGSGAKSPRSWSFLLWNYT